MPALPFEIIDRILIELSDLSGQQSTLIAAIPDLSMDNASARGVIDLLNRHVSSNHAEYDLVPAHFSTREISIVDSRLPASTSVPLNAFTFQDFSVFGEASVQKLIPPLPLRSTTLIDEKLELPATKPDPVISHDRSALLNVRSKVALKFDVFSGGILPGGGAEGAVIEAIMVVELAIEVVEALTVALVAVGIIVPLSPFVVL
ncbi:hypothetical protein BJ742DRAFT_737239 [Cladochytrium replicatum]|nr:hypothetical protein BJ742DRAFT_737239 [Cladochytrium replicatum]